MAASNPAPSFTQKTILQHRPFRTLWLAQFVSIFGDFLALFGVISLITFRLHGTALQVTAVTIAYVLPLAVISPVAGVFVDHWNVKRVMIASDMIRAILIVLLALTILITLTRNWNAWEGGKVLQVTDDAYVRGDLTPLSTKVAGIVRAVHVADFQQVHKGDLIVELRSATAGESQGSLIVSNTRNVHLDSGTRMILRAGGQAQN